MKLSTATGKLKIAIDDISVNIYIDNGITKEPIHVCYWIEDEWIEDPEFVVPAIIQAIKLFYTDKKQLLNKLNIRLD